MRSDAGIRKRGYVHKVVLLLIYLFILAPELVIVLVSVNAGQYLTFPPQGFSMKWFVRFAHSETFITTMSRSLILATFATVASVALGIISAYFVVRYGGRFRRQLRLLMISPRLFPAVITGVALLIFYYRVIGWGTTSYWGLLLPHVMISFPYVFLTVSSQLYNFDLSLEEAARALGASKLRTFLKVTLPLNKAGIISGAVFAFVVSYTELPMTLLLAGRKLTTLPIELYDYIRWSFDPTGAAVGIVNILLALVAVWITEKLVGLETLRW